MKINRTGPTAVNTKVLLTVLNLIAMAAFPIKLCHMQLFVPQRKIWPQPVLNGNHLRLTGVDFVSIYGPKRNQRLNSESPQSVLTGTKKFCLYM